MQGRISSISLYFSYLHIIHACCLFRLEAYDKNADFGGTDYVADGGDWKMTLPDMNAFRDVTTPDCLPRFTTDRASSFLEPHGASIDRQATQLYESR